MLIYITSITGGLTCTNHSILFFFFPFFILLVLFGCPKYQQDFSCYSRKLGRSANCALRFFSSATLQSWLSIYLSTTMRFMHFWYLYPISKPAWKITMREPPLFWLSSTRFSSSAGTWKQFTGKTKKDKQSGLAASSRGLFS